MQCTILLNLYQRRILSTQTSEFVCLWRKGVCLKGKFPQTTLWIGWVESNFRNPTVNVWADLDNPFKTSKWLCKVVYVALSGWNSARICVTVFQQKKISWISKFIHKCMLINGSGSGSVLHTTPWWAITVQWSRTFVAATIKFWSELCWPNYIRPCWTGLL